MVARVTLLILGLHLAVCLESPGINNIYYPIPYYYGSRFKERESKKSLVNDSPSILSLGYTYSNDYESNLWIADKTHHVIKYIDKRIGAIYIVAGIYGTSGYRDGNVVKSMFNKPTSLDVWRSSTHDQIRAKNTKPVLLSQEGAARYEGKFATKNNYTDCGGEIITVDATSTSSQQTTTSASDTVDEKLVKYIGKLKFQNLDFTEDSEYSRTANTLGTTYVYVADTGNHGIRRISLDDSNVETVAGIGGTSGFLDGPLGVSLLNSPQLVALDALGNNF